MRIVYVLTEGKRHLETNAGVCCRSSACVRVAGQFTLWDTWYVPAPVSLATTQAWRRTATKLQQLPATESIPPSHHPSLQDHDHDPELDTPPPQTMRFLRSIATLLAATGAAAAAGWGFEDASVKVKSKHGDDVSEKYGTPLSPLRGLIRARRCWAGICC